MRWFWIDRFEEFEPGKRAVAVKCVSLAEEHLHDHMPAFPVMPNALLIEGMAQTGGILVGQIRNFQEKVVLAKINKAVFHRHVLPGDRVKHEAVITNLTDVGASIDGTTTCEGELVAEISMMFSHIDQNMAGTKFPEENFVFHEGFDLLLDSFDIQKQAPAAAEAE